MAAVDSMSGENGSSTPTHHHHHQQPQPQHLSRPASPTPSSSPPPLDPTTVMHLEPRPFRPFKSSEEYLWAMKEDLAEWLNALYGLDLAAENFLDKLETGVTLCQHANNVRRLAAEQQQQQQRGGGEGGGGRNGFHQLTVPTKEVVYRADVPPGTFHARDNVSNFIAWCRALGVHECLQFETDDLVMRKNERSFILCLLEVARQGAKLGMPAPLLVQMEEEIDREIAKDQEKKDRWEKNGEREDEEEEEFLSSTSSSDEEPPRQIITNDLKSLDEMVRDLVNRCSCPIQFPMVRVSEGKYRIGDTNTHIFVRILRSHVMVRVGGGWDTLEHYLDKHDPCRCRQGHRFAVGSKLMIKHNLNNPAQTQMQVTYERSPDPYRAGHQPVPGRKSMGYDSPLRMRRASLSSIPSSHDSRSSLASIGSDKDRLSGDKTRRYSGDHSAAILASLPPSGGETTKHRSSSPGGEIGKQASDRSSEQSDEGYQSGSKVPSFRTKKFVPQQKLLKLNESGVTDGGRDDGSDCSSVVSGFEKLGSPESPCSSVDEHPLQTPAKQVATNLQDGRRGRASVPAKTSKTSGQQPYGVTKMTRKKSQSTENLGDQMLTVPYSTSAYSLSKGRRSSVDKLAGAARNAATMTRSRSQCSEDSEMAAYLSHKGPGRGSLRLSRIPRVAPGGNNTWSHRQRDSRPTLTADLFSGRPPRASGGSHSPSPHRRKSATPRSSPPRSVQSSPSTHVSPIIQQVLAAAEDSNEELLQKMAELIQVHFNNSEEEPPPPQPPTEVMPGENYTKYWLATSNQHAPRKRHSSGTSHSLDSPEDSGGSDVAEQQHPPTTSKIPVRIGPRRDHTPGPTRIPMPTFYKF